VIAFIAIDANDDSSGAASENAYQGQADRICVDGKQKLVAAGRRSFNGSTPNSFASYAASAREISDQTRSELAKLEPSEDLRRQADALDASLRGLDPPLDQLERAARAQDTQRIEAAVGVVQAASQRSDNAVDALGLQACARLKVGLLRVEPR
jgi:hypothetical protein